MWLSVTTLFTKGKHLAGNSFVLLRLGACKHHPLRCNGTYLAPLSLNIKFSNIFSLTNACFFVPTFSNWGLRRTAGIEQLFYSPLRHLFIPVFLNCWLAKRALENMFVSVVAFSIASCCLFCFRLFLLSEVVFLT